MSTCLLTLPVDVLVMILEIIDKESRHTIKALAMANKHLYGISGLVRHRYKVLDLVDDVFHARDHLNGWLQNPAVLSGLRHLTVIGSFAEIFAHEIYRSQRKLDAYSVNLGQLVQRAAKIDTLTWTSELLAPIVVLETLHKYHPNGKLTIHDFYRGPMIDHIDPIQQCIASSSALTLYQVTIGTTIWEYNPALYPDLRMGAICRTIANAPNLQSVFVKNEAFPMPDEDVLKNLHFDHKGPNKSIKHFSLAGTRPDLDLIFDWSRFVSFSTLISLELKTSILIAEQFFDWAVFNLKSLKCLSLVLEGLEHYPGQTALLDEIALAAEHYFSNCSPLSSIKLWGWKGGISLVDIMLHGATLRRLELHEPIDLFSYVDERSSQRVLSAKDVQYLCSKCPILEELTIDICRCTGSLSLFLLEEEAGNVKIYEFLATLPRLAELGIHFNLGTLHMIGNSQEDSERTRERLHHLSAHPNFNPYFRHIWQTVFGNKTSDCHLHLKFGDVCYWQVNRSERDDRRALGDLVVSEVPSKLLYD